MFSDAMLKMLGINPADLQKQINGASELCSKTIADFNARFDTIQQQNAEILTLLKGSTICPQLPQTQTSTPPAEPAPPKSPA